MAVTPILPRNAEPGILITGAAEPEAFVEDDITFLETIANVVATVLDSHQAVNDLRFNALHDDLTGLPNRTLVLDRLELALEQTLGTDCEVAVLICDLDRFKVVNDGMGHAAGDLVLRTVAERLRELVRPGDTVGRFGGDEFVIVCPDIDEPAEIVEIAERLADAFTEPMEVAGADLVATASIGIAIGHDTGPEPAATLLRDADAAMYRAKARGRARYEIFDDEMRAWAAERLRIETELRHAITHGELVLHYQPVLDVASGETVGVEALVRWQHPHRGLLQPHDFLGVAADAGMLPDLGRWAFAEAAGQMQRWVAGGGWDERWTAVNLSAQELGDPRLIDDVRTVIAEVGIDPVHLRVELTEDALIEDTVQVGEILDALRAIGLGISVDDFGTGYSSLAYLKRFPVDCLKLDRTFVSGLDEREDDLVIASAVISMGGALGLDVVAEGVETDAQLEALRRIGCGQVQGFLFAHPMPADAVDAWLAAR